MATEDAVNPIILIGGPPGAGKTTLAGGIAAHLGRKTITMDDLVVAARAVTTRETHPSLFPAAGQTHYEYFTNSPPERLIADSQQLANAVWPIAERTIRYQHATGTELVMDYWLFEPAKVASLEPAVVAIWLHIDPEALEQRELANDWTMGSTDPEQMHSNFMARSLWRNTYLVEQAAQFGQPVLRLSGSETREEVVAAALDVIAL
ncbi:MAG: hypothetical protein HKN91_03165 [Acidimicrobiia bacterium]|nr:hypothetical protein [Acidimicrobiia bacterium]